MRPRSIMTYAFWTCMALGTARTQASPHPGMMHHVQPHFGAVVQGPSTCAPVPFALPQSPPTVIQYNPQIGLYWGPCGPVPYSPPFFVIGSGAYWPSYPPVPTIRGLFPGEMFPSPEPEPPPQLQVPDQPPLSQPVMRTKRIDPGRAKELIAIGDRHFRAKDLRRTSQRYEQALLAEPGSAVARVRLAQVALVRGQFTEAANRLREALAAEPDWLAHAPDIQDLYGEPSDFKDQVAKLERHLKDNPNDRDAWLVLGAQWFLSGRTRQAADIFHRLSARPPDRPPDPTLAAFLDASQANP
jgi:tetratricopeptide (TPR) repeat protein